MSTSSNFSQRENNSSESEGPGRCECGTSVETLLFLYAIWSILMGVLLFFTTYFLKDDSSASAVFRAFGIAYVLAGAFAVFIVLTNYKWAVFLLVVFNIFTTISTTLTFMAAIYMLTGRVEKNELLRDHPVLAVFNIFILVPHLFISTGAIAVFGNVCCISSVDDDSEKEDKKQYSSNETTQSKVGIDIADV